MGATSWLAGLAQGSFLGRVGRSVSAAFGYVCYLCGDQQTAPGVTFAQLRWGNFGARRIRPGSLSGVRGEQLLGSFRVRVLPLARPGSSRTAIIASQGVYRRRWKLEHRRWGVCCGSFRRTPIVPGMRPGKRPEDRSDALKASPRALRYAPPVPERGRCKVSRCGGRLWLSSGSRGCVAATSRCVRRRAGGPLAKRNAWGVTRLLRKNKKKR